MLLLMSSANTTHYSLSVPKSTVGRAIMTIMLTYAVLILAYGFLLVQAVIYYVMGVFALPGSSEASSSLQQIFTFYTTVMPVLCVLCGIAMGFAFALNWPWVYGWSIVPMGVALMGIGYFVYFT